MLFINVPESHGVFPVIFLLFSVSRVLIFIICSSQPGGKPFPNGGPSAKRLERPPGWFFYVKFWLREYICDIFLV